MEFFEALAQILIAVGLSYGVIIVFRHWKTTVPPGGASDAQFANHSRVVTARWVQLMNQRARSNRPRGKPLDKRDRIVIDRWKLTPHEYSRP